MVFMLSTSNVNVFYYRNAVRQRVRQVKYFNISGPSRQKSMVEFYGFNWVTYFSEGTELGVGFPLNMEQWGIRED